jgi:cellulose synthase/poly-beta-1,6-N-acetylglucosamine synthase-like glycosyltransferase
MNYGLMISNKVEEKLIAVERDIGWSQIDEDREYYRCLQQVLTEEEGRAWAGGNIRVGDYILLVDSDTRVPTDCLLDAVSEMDASPEIAILQYTSGVMQVTTNFFENGITFFTNLIYTAIRYTVANGDVVPFVGHNAVLRWSALQDVSFTDEDGYEKFWSESSVSEDFDMALRLQCAGYILRFGAYTAEGFKEGVSLTVYDELNRWEKYAYGCNELLFYPVRYWPVRGLFTPLFRRFVTSNMRITSKITILAYIGTYYALGAAWILSMLNYFLIGWFNGYLDKYYLDGFKAFFALILVFTAFGNVSLAVLRYRIDNRNLLSARKHEPVHFIWAYGLMDCSDRKLQMGFALNRVPWRSVAAHLASLAQSHVRD